MMKLLNLFIVILIVCDQHVPHGLGVRIPAFHAGGPGSIPGVGVLFVNNYCRSHTQNLAYRKINYYFRIIGVETSTSIRG